MSVRVNENGKIKINLKFNWKKSRRRTERKKFKFPSYIKSVTLHIFRALGVALTSPRVVFQSDICAEISQFSHSRHYRKFKGRKRNKNN